jgi:hypothetical protein
VAVVVGKDGFARFSPFGRTWLMGQKKSLRVQPEISHDRAQPLGIDVRVARGCCDALMAQERLDVAQVGSALVEKERGGRMPQVARGNNQRPRALAGELVACVGVGVLIFDAVCLVSCRIGLVARNAPKT